MMPAFVPLPWTADFWHPTQCPKGAPPHKVQRALNAFFRRCFLVSSDHFLLGPMSKGDANGWHNQEVPTTWKSNVMQQQNKRTTLQLDSQRNNHSTVQSFKKTDMQSLKWSIFFGKFFELLMHDGRKLRCWCMKLPMKRNQKPLMKLNSWRQTHVCWCCCAANVVKKKLLKESVMSHRWKTTQNRKPCVSACNRKDHNQECNWIGGQKNQKKCPTKEHSMVLSSHSESPAPPATS